MQAGDRIVFPLMDIENTWKCWKTKQGVMMYLINKKVLLREHKRHTARRVASARHAVPCWEGRYPPQTWEGRYLPPTQKVGTPLSRPGKVGTPPCPEGRYPPQVWTDRQTENITFPILLMRAVIKSSDNWNLYSLSEILLVLMFLNLDSQESEPLWWSGI